MLTAHSSKFSKPEIHENGLLRLINLISGEELFVQQCRFFDSVNKQSILMEAPVSGGKVEIVSFSKE